MRMRVQPAEVSMGAAGCDAARFSGGGAKMPPPTSSQDRTWRRHHCARRHGREMKIDAMIYLRHEE